MTAVLSLVVVAALGLLVTRVATVALMLTGMSRDSARFQARSALTGTGFTTSEAESVVDHPVRRRVVMALMLASGAGVVSAIAALVLSFVGLESTAAGLRRALVLTIGMLGLVWASRSEPVDAALRRAIERALRRWTTLDVQDYSELLHVREDWGVAQVHVDHHNWLAAGPLSELRLPEEGVAVLGVERRDGSWVGAPPASMRLCPGDVVVLYGRRPVLEDLNERVRGRTGAIASEASRRRHADECGEPHAGGIGAAEPSRGQ